MADTDATSVRERAARARAKASGVFVLHRPGAKSINIGGQVVNVVEDAPLDAAPTLTITLDDPNWTLTNSNVFDVKLDGRLDYVETFYEGTAYCLVKVSPQNDQLTLVFEDRDVTLLREFVEAGKFQRKRTANYTRAMFIRDVIKRVNKRNRTKVDFVCPRLHQKQAIARDQTPRASSDSTGERGISKRESRKLTVKGAKMTGAQRKNANLVLKVAEAEDAPKKAKLALMAACIVESRILNPAGGDGTSVGILQVTAGKHFNRRDVERCAKEFLINGFTGQGGAITLANTTTLTAGEIAQAVQGSAYPDAYAQWMSEAEDILFAFNGGDLAEPSTTFNKYTENAYFFQLGQVGQPESAWDCITRLAAEVNWRLFVKNGAVYFVPDDDMYRQEPKRSLSRSTLFFIKENKHSIVKAGNMTVTDMSFDWDEGKLVQEMTVTLADRIKLDRGETIETTGFGPASTRWLVWSVSKSLADENSEVTLRSPQRVKKEPSAGRTSHTLDRNRNAKRPKGYKGDTDIKRGFFECITADHHIIGTPGVGTHSWTEPPNNWESDNAYDFACPTGTELYAAFKGRIGPELGYLGNEQAQTKQNPGGRFAGIRLHLVGESNELYYAHMSRLKPGLAAGDLVNGGDLLGYSGEANGVEHLHLGEKRSDRPYLKWYVQDHGAPSATDPRKGDFGGPGGR